MANLALLTAALLLVEPNVRPGLQALLVVNQPAQTVQRIEIPTGKIVFTARSGERSHDVAISPDGRFAVTPIYGNGTVGRPGTDGSSLELATWRRER